MMTVGAGERFANTPCGCSLSQEPDATEGRTIATLAESLNGKNGHKYSNFSQCIHGDPREPGFSTTPCFDLLQTKPGTRTKLYTLNSSFLI